MAACQKCKAYNLIETTHFKQSLGQIATIACTPKSALQQVLSSQADSDIASIRFSQIDLVSINLTSSMSTAAARMAPVSVDHTASFTTDLPFRMFTTATTAIGRVSQMAQS
jgi:hypothetical protein